jgi:arylsulfatase A-like enzyme
MKHVHLPMVLFILPAILMVSCSKQEERKPNIIFIMSDDHAFQAVSAYGDRLIQTPNIDKLANEGMRFDRAYVTNSICAPSRAVILTGKHSHINGLRDNIGRFDSTQTTFPKLLQEAGYQTAIVGKWHLKSEPTGFNYWKVLVDQGDYYQPVFKTSEGMIKEKGYVTDVITDMALEFLAGQANQDKPFMLMYQHKAPHREWSPAQKYLDAFWGKSIPVPKTLFDDYQNRGSAARQAEMRIADHMGLTNDNKIKPEIIDSLGIEEFYKWYANIYNDKLARLTPAERKHWDSIYDPMNEGFLKNPPQGDSLTLWKYRRYMEDYLATIKSIDDNVGRVLDYLDESGLAENTIVVYTSDQGFYLGEHGWFDKRFMYEESFRTPLLVRWPDKIKAGAVNSNLVQNLDFAETFLDLAGVEIPGDMQGKSLLPLFAGNDKDWRDALYYHYYEFPGFHGVKRHYGVSTDRYKLIHFYYDVDEWELYDLEKDPDELQNVIDNPEYEQVKEALLVRLDELRKQYGDSDELTKEILQSDLKRK